MPTGRLDAYRRLSRLLLPRRYTGKMLLLAFVSTHVPLLALGAYILLVADLDPATTWTLVLVGTAATLLGTALALAGMWVLLAPVASASAALRAYHQHGTRPALPTEIDDEGGRLLADVQHSLESIDALLDQLRKRAARDGLTGVYNRASGEERLRTELAARTDDVPLALVMLDADGLKSINDRWGHPMGDTGLRHLAGLLARQVGDQGWVARWGGDEFIMVLRVPAGAPPPEVVLDRICTELMTNPVHLPSGESLCLGVSRGIAWAAAEDDAQTLIARADAALYRHKRARGSSPVTRHRDDGDDVRPAAETYRLTPG